MEPERYVDTVYFPTPSNAVIATATQLRFDRRTTLMRHSCNSCATLCETFVQLPFDARKSHGRVEVVRRSSESRDGKEPKMFGSGSIRFLAKPGFWLGSFLPG